MKKTRSTRFILNLLGIGTALSLLGDATLYTVLPHPDVSAQMGITLSMVGLLLGANRAIRLVINGPVGILYDRMPRRGLLVAALALGAGSSIFYAVSTGFWSLLAGRILWGVAWSLLWVGGNSVVLDVSTEENRGRNSSIYQMWFFIGVATASLFGALLTDLVGFRNGQWISVAVIAAAALAWAFLLPETRRQMSGSEEAGGKTDKPAVERMPWKVIAKASLTVFVTRFLAWGVLAATAILWLSDMFGKGAQIVSIFIPIATLTGVYTALINLVSIGTTPLAGSVSDRVGRRWPIIGVAMILGAAGLWLMRGEIRLLALIGAFLVPLTGSTTETLVPAIAGDSVPTNFRSRALGLINTAGDFGATIGPFAALGAAEYGLVLSGRPLYDGECFVGRLGCAGISPPAQTLIDGHSQMFECRAGNGIN